MLPASAVRDFTCIYLCFAEHLQRLVRLYPGAEGLSVEFACPDDQYNVRGVLDEACQVRRSASRWAVKPSSYPFMAHMLPRHVPKPGSCMNPRFSPGLLQTCTYFLINQSIPTRSPC